MFQWKPQMVQFMKDASEYGNYNQILADKIAHYLPENASVCDAGCGLGYLSLELSKYCKCVTAIDLVPQALSVLRENLQKFVYHNIIVVEGDIKSCNPEELYDSMIFCFFGSAYEALHIAKMQCSGKVVLIRKNWDTHRFTLSKKPLDNDNCTFVKTQEILQEMGIPFISETFELEMGQPFHTIKDAVAFFRTYSKDALPQNICKKDIIDKLTYRPSELFPFYLPLQKQMGMIVLDTGDIPDSINEIHIA